MSAIRSGDLLFLSGLMAVEKDGRLIDAATVDARPALFANPVAAEMRSILHQAEAICRNAGTSLKNVVRIQQFHTQLDDLPAALEVWSGALDGQPLPISAIEVPWLPVPGARILVGLWVYAPIVP